MTIHLRPASLLAAALAAGAVRIAPGAPSTRTPAAPGTAPTVPALPPYGSPSARTRPGTVRRVGLPERGAAV
ncbi:hypothetical protein C0216_16665 [Streptomyces globosus]|uniref:Uncharacterized protein n=1 Tax=Streptomyces globosus TaxID=68209 RepID=A0A344U1U7_9ACTN|nr:MULTISPECIES: hypothetical protein [Streptomyces]AXE24868.1 hypothetical protein C0216_16665 [Streptomyces globosus]